MKNLANMVDNLNTLQFITRAEAEKVVQYIEDPRPAEKNGEKVTKGHIGNIIVLVSPKMIKTYGSLARFLYGSNLKELDMMTSRRDAVTKLSDELHMDMSDSIIRKIEIGKIFSVPREPIEYISLFWHFPRLRRIYFDPTSIYFQSTKKKLGGGGFGDPTRQFKAYDKFLQAKQYGWEIPDILQSTPYLLKMEEAFWEVSRQMRWGKPVRMRELWDPIFDNLMRNRLYKSYSSIKKLDGSKMKKPIEELTSTDIFNAICARIFHDVGGKEWIDKYLAPFFQNPKTLKKDVKSRFNQKIANTMKYLSVDEGIITELDEIVKTTLF